jgi:8-oxo-dGTP pyrophosphatase MutT (NUDIX family)
MTPPETVALERPVHRRELLEMLQGYRESHPDEAATVGRFCAFVGHHPDCFERACQPGHVTASAWIVSHDHRRFLLTHHRKLGRWLQLGGHADGDPDVARVALREAREESGMSLFDQLVDPVGSAGSALLDIDVHAIPARPGEPRHEHFDFRFLLAAKPGQPLRISDESTDLRWFSRDRMAEIGNEQSLLRLARKARARLGSS